jgi:aspartate 1-decarboxylase
MSYVQLDESELNDWEAEILFFNEKNEIIDNCKKK